MSDHLHSLAAMLAVELAAVEPGEQRRQLRARFDTLVDRGLLAAAANLADAAPFLERFTAELGVAVSRDQFSVLVQEGTREQ